MKKQEIRFGKHGPSGRFMVVHVVGGIKDGTMKYVIEGLTAKQARAIVKRLGDDLDIFNAK